MCVLAGMFITLVIQVLAWGITDIIRGLTEEDDA